MTTTRTNVQPLDAPASTPTAASPSTAPPTAAPTAAVPAAPAPDAAEASRGSAVCCHREMSSIEVTARGTTLVLHTCASCGRHLWERDGQRADRAELLAGVKTFLEQPRLPVRRRRRSKSV